MALPSPQPRRLREHNKVGSCKVATLVHTVRRSARMYGRAGNWAKGEAAYSACQPAEATGPVLAWDNTTGTVKVAGYVAPKSYH
jgi:hypothetical protein